MSHLHGIKNIRTHHSNDGDITSRVPCVPRWLREERTRKNDGRESASSGQTLTTETETLTFRTRRRQTLTFEL
ncbi:unnamed protein product [Amoebophrya sp. A25]|nr:unnamed protein product [Amoebophrya sp. A25]|eukprot:GSA25T00011495001.1